MNRNRTGKRAILPLMAIALLACAGMIVILRPRDSQDVPVPTSYEKPTEVTIVTENQKNEPLPSGKNIRIVSPGPPEKIPARSLEKRRGDLARQWWIASKKAYPQELNRNMDRLSEKLGLPPVLMDSIGTIFRREETVWMEHLDRKLEPVFLKGEKPDFRSIMSQEYRTLVDRICSDTDSQVRTLLTDKQWIDFGKWREAYNRDRYYWSEGNPRD